MSRDTAIVAGVTVVVLSEREVVGYAGAPGQPGADGANTSHYLEEIITSNGGRSFALDPAPQANSVRFSLNGLNEYDFTMSGATVVPNFTFLVDDVVQIWWTA